MAGVFKSLDKSDVRLTPFRTHKEWFNADYEKVEIDSSIIYYTGNQAAVGYDLKSSLGAQLSGSNYFYFIVRDVNGFSFISLVDVNDNFTPLAFHPDEIQLNLLAGLGSSQSNLAYYEYGDTELVTLDRSLNPIDVTKTFLDLSGNNYAKLSYIPNSPNNYIILNGGDSGNVLSATLDDSSAFTAVPNDLITGVSESGDYYDSVHLTGSYTISLFKKNTTANGMLDGRAYLGLFDAGASGIISSSAFSPSNALIGVCPVRQTVMQHNGDSEYGFLFTTLNAPEKRWLYITRIFVEGPVATNTTIYDTIRVDTLPNTVSILTAKSYFRNGVHSFNEPVHIMSADGLLYLNVARTVTGTNDTMTYSKIVSFIPYIGTKGRVISATINTDHDLVHPNSPTLITILASDDWYQNPGDSFDRGNLGCLFTVTYNSTDDVIYNPVYIGNATHDNNNPFIGDDYTTASNFNANFLAQGAIGLGYKLDGLTNPFTGGAGNFFYKFNR